MAKYNKKTHYVNQKPIDNSKTTYGDDFYETYPVDTIAWTQQIDKANDLRSTDPIDDMVKLHGRIWNNIDSKSKKSQKEISLFEKIVCTVAGFVSSIFAMAIIWIIFRNKPFYNSYLRYCYKGMGYFCIFMLAFVVILAVFGITTGKSTISLPF